MNFSDKLLATFLITTGSGGSLLAVLEPWQETLEWGLRVSLLLLSIASVVAGLVVAWSKRRPGRPANEE